MTSSAAPASLDPARAGAWCAFVARALVAARANRSWPDLRAFAGHVAAASPAVHEGLGPPLVLDDATGLLPWDVWARVKADHAVAKEEAPHGSPWGAAAGAGRGAARRRYHDALRALPAPRIGDVEQALRSTEAKGARKIHVVLDKVEGSGAIVRLAADVTVARKLTDERLRELLFPMTAFAVELTLVRLLAADGVLDVERVTRGAVDLCACAGARPRALAESGLGGDVLALSFSTCAADVTPGDNDLLPHEVTPLAELAREHLAGRALPHRVYRDRKVVTTDAAAARAAAARAGVRTVVYELAREVAA